jgi:hypothetical protein
MGLDIPDSTPRPKAETIILDRYGQLARIDGAFLWPHKGAVVQLGEPNREVIVKRVRLLLTASLASVCIDVSDRDAMIPSASEGARPSVRTRLAVYLHDRARFTEHGNGTALRVAAGEVERLPDDDPRLAQLDALQAKQRLNVLMLLSDESGQLVDRYGLGWPGDVATVGELLDRLIECEVAASIDYDNPQGGDA